MGVPLADTRLSPHCYLKNIGQDERTVHLFLTYTSRFQVNTMAHGTLALGD